MRQLGWWLGSLGSSMCADQVFFLALTWAAIQVGTPVEVGAVVAAVSVPRIALLLVGGTLADRIDPRLLALWSDVGRAVALVAAVGVVLSVNLQIWHLVVIGVVVGALDGFFAPAIGAMPALIAPANLMGRVGGMRTVVQRVALLLAGPLAGATIAWAGQVAGFATAAALFALSVTFLLLIKRPRVSATPPPDLPAVEGKIVQPSPPPSFVADLTGGFAVLRQHRVVAWLLVVAAALNLGFAGPVNAGLPLLADQQLWGASGAGLLLGAFGLGAAATGLTIAALHYVPHAGAVMLSALTVMGAAIAAFALTTSLPAALTIAIVLGLASGTVGSILHSTLLTTTPPAALGRIMALLALTLEGAFPVSTFLTGLTTQAYGTDVAFLAGGAILILTAAAAATRPALRTLHMPRPPHRSGTAPQPR